MKYRILYHHRTQALDGQRVHIRAIQDALRELGHEVIEVAPLPATERAGAAAVRTRKRVVLQTLAEHTPAALYEGLELAYNLEAYRTLRSTIKRVRPHVIYERYALNTVAGIWASRKFGLPLLLEVNSPLAEEKRLHGRMSLQQLSAKLERYILSNATRVLAVTQVLADMVGQSAGLSKERTLVVQNGADLKQLTAADQARGQARRALGFDHSHVVIGAVGFFREWHGIDRLLNVIHRSRATIPAARVLLVGDGPAVPQLKRLVTTLGLDDVTRFTGTVSHERVVEHLAATDVAVIPRAVPYASPLKLFEYMAAGRAIIAPRQPNLLEVVTENRDALCFDPENMEEFAGAVVTAVNDGELRTRLGEAARQTVSRRGFTWRGNAERIVDVIGTVGRGPGT